MNIGEKIIDAIGRGSMFATHDSDGKPIESPLIYVWSSGASEQLEAVVEADRKITEKEMAIDFLQSEEGVYAGRDFDRESEHFGWWYCAFRNGKAYYAPKLIDAVRMAKEGGP